MRLTDDDFQLFGLAPAFRIDMADLESRRRALQAEVHPDRFAAQGAAAQRLAMQWAVRVNEAHLRLRDPLSRGAYLCELHGSPVQAESNTAMPVTFLQQQMTWREALEEAESLEAVQGLDDEVAAHERGLLDSLGRQLDIDHDTPAAVLTVRALMFVARFRQDICQRLEALET